LYQYYIVRGGASGLRAVGAVKGLVAGTRGRVGGGHSLGGGRMGSLSTAGSGEAAYVRDRDTVRRVQGVRLRARPSRQRTTQGLAERAWIGGNPLRCSDMVLGSEAARGVLEGSRSRAVRRGAASGRPEPDRGDVIHDDAA